MKEWIAIVSYDTGITATPDDVGRKEGSSFVDVEYYLDDPSQLVDLFYNGPNKDCIRHVELMRSSTERFPTVSMLDLHDRYIEEGKRRTTRRNEDMQLGRKEHG